MFLFSFMQFMVSNAALVCEGILRAKWVRLVYIFLYTSFTLLSRFLYDSITLPSRILYARRIPGNRDRENKTCPVGSPGTPKQTEVLTLYHLSAAWQSYPVFQGKTHGFASPAFAGFAIIRMLERFNRSTVRILTWHRRDMSRL